MKNPRCIFLILWSFFFVFFVSDNGYAGEPTNQLRASIDKVLDVLRNSELKKPNKEEERRVAIRKVVGERFDFEEMSKRTLAQNWQRRTPEEKKEFVPLFSDLLERSYINKIESYTDEKITYLDEKIDGDFSVVKTKVVTRKNIETPIDYKLIKEGTQWKVYDVIIEGVSLINNYRNQFNSVIRNQSYEELVKRLKNKQVGAMYEEKRK